MYEAKLCFFVDISIADMNVKQLPVDQLDHRGSTPVK